MEVSHGPEYRVVAPDGDRRGRLARCVRVALERLADLPAAGWYSGDLHVHMNYGGAYRNTPAGWRRRRGPRTCTWWRT